MNTNLRIKPFPISFAHNIVIGEGKVNLELGKCTIPVTLCASDGTAIETRHAVLEGADYEAWAADDQYAINKVLEQLQITPAGATVIEAPAPEVTAPEAEQPEVTAPEAQQPEVTVSESETSDPAATEGTEPEKKSKKKGKG